MPHTDERSALLHRKHQLNFGTTRESDEQDGRNNQHSDDHHSSSLRSIHRSFTMISRYIAVGASVSILLGTLTVPERRRNTSVLTRRSVKDDTFDEKEVLNIETNVTSTPPLSSLKPPTQDGIPVKRCKYIIDLFRAKDFGKTKEDLKEKYTVQVSDVNVFYRATANIFWKDFALGGWHENRLSFSKIGIDEIVINDGINHNKRTQIQPKATWTWVTGDQHLSNFGAWKNRHLDIVYSVNDFDEAAIYDFQVDVLRIATSICSHAYTNKLADEDIKQALRAFTESYVDTLVDYVGGDREQLFEITPKTAAPGSFLQSFLLDVADPTRGDIRKSYKHQVKKFTEDGKRFTYNEKTRLVKISPELESEIRSQFTDEKYGATLMKVGWHVYEWGDLFEVMDVAARVGSGVGSYGVDRYYVLLKGNGTSWSEGSDDLSAVILDVKYEPTPAVHDVLSKEDKAWYHNMFPNAAARAIEAQRRLTSYTDPFTGWIMLGGRPFVVRERSPWKSAPNLDLITDPDEYIRFTEQIAIVTATSHARGTVGKSPGQFKHVIKSLLGHWMDRLAWSNAVADAALDYRSQVRMDYECFRDYVNEKYHSSE